MNSGMQAILHWTSVGREGAAGRDGGWGAARAKEGAKMCQASSLDPFRMVGSRRRRVRAHRRRRDEGDGRER